VSQFENVTVLAFRESRGWEVKHNFFTQQFINIMKQKDTQLNQSIDGITGATLSVNALKVQTRMALYLHEKTRTSSH
jgi:Na+-translocating ferredoxin:NAD+ oxidoreductase RnfG subunit